MGKCLGAVPLLLHQLDIFYYVSGVYSFWELFFEILLGEIWE